MRELEGVVKQQNQTLHEMRVLMSRMRERAAASHGAQARAAHPTTYRSPWLGG